MLPPKQYLALAVVILVLPITLSLAQNPFDRPPKRNHYVFAVGNFTYMQEKDIKVNCITMWDISKKEWYFLTDGLVDQSIGLNNETYTIASNGDDSQIYIGGYFTGLGSVTNGTLAKNKPLNLIARWNATANQFFALGQGLGDPKLGDYVSAIVVTDQYVFVGGQFNSTYDKNITGLNNVALWHRKQQEWDKMGPFGLQFCGNNTTPAVVSMSINYRGLLYVLASDEITSCLTAYDVVANSWHSIPFTIQPPGSQAWVMAADGEGDLYLGGSFLQVNLIPVQGIALYNSLNDRWSSVGSGLAPYGSVPITITAILPHGKSDVYIGGRFQFENTISSNVARLVTLSGIPTFIPLGAGVDGSYFGAVSYVSSLAFGSGPTGNNTLFIGGHFLNAGGDILVHNIVAYDLLTARYFAMLNGTEGHGVRIDVNGLISMEAESPHNLDLWTPVVIALIISDGAMIVLLIVIALINRLQLRSIMGVTWDYDSMLKTR